MIDYEIYDDYPPPSRPSPVLGLAGLAWMVLMGIILLSDLQTGKPDGLQLDQPTAGKGNQSFVQKNSASSEQLAPQPTPITPADWVDPSTLFAAPYQKYTITQRSHGQSYGHNAVDLAAGKGEPVLSPIHGVVSELYVDVWSNPVLVIENKKYRVTLMHGDYLVTPGEQVSLGQVVGHESNHGYTTDYYGVPCAGRDCGYHTHLNVFDKELGVNVYPLDLIQSQ